MSRDALGGPQVRPHGSSHVAVGKVFKRVLKAAGLPSSLSPHSLRHTFAILLIRRGAPLTYVRDILGHSSITITADAYARHLPTGDKALVDALDGEGLSSQLENLGSKTVAVTGETWGKRSDISRVPADPSSSSLVEAGIALRHRRGPATLVGHA